MLSGSKILISSGELCEFYEKKKAVNISTLSSMESFQWTRLICWHDEVQLLLGVQTLHWLGKSLVWGSAQPLLSGTELSWQRTKPVCNQEDCSNLQTELDLFFPLIIFQGGNHSFNAGSIGWLEEFRKAGLETTFDLPNTVWIFILCVVYPAGN